MTDFNELRPGALKRQSFNDTLFSRGDEFAPEAIDPQEFKGEASSGDIKIVTPLSVFSGKYFPQKFSAKANIPQSGKFKKTKLGDFETEDTTSMLQPSETAFPPQKRTLSKAGKIEDAMAQLISGAAGGVGDIVSFPRQMADALNTAADRNVVPSDWLHMLPSKADLGKFAMANQRFIPLPQESIQRISEDPLSAGGDYAKSMGGYIPYSVGGVVPGLRGVLARIWRIQNLMP